MCSRSSRCCRCSLSCCSVCRRCLASLSASSIAACVPYLALTMTKPPCKQHVCTRQVRCIAVQCNRCDPCLREKLTTSSKPALKECEALRASLTHHTVVQSWAYEMVLHMLPIRLTHASYLCAKVAPMFGPMAGLCTMSCSYL